MMSRRTLILTSMGLLGATALPAGFYFYRSQNKTLVRKGRFEIEKTEEEWKRILTPNQFAVLRKHGTEREGTSPLLKEKRKGVYQCAGCKLPVYRSQDKYDSGTGWPSFIRAIPNNIGTQEDNSAFLTRTEVHCRRCGGHLGHVFDDGPAPTGKRHCINGLALIFIADKA